MNFKPFYIKTRDLTKEQVVEVIDKSVEAGAVLYHGVKGVHPLARAQYKSFIWKYIGVNCDDRTSFEDNRHYYNMSDESAIEITFEQLDEHLGLVSKQEESSNKCTELRNVKIDLRREDGTVDKELSSLFQEAVFESGGRWIHAGDVLSNTEEPLLFVSDRGEISWANKDEDEYFNSHTNKPIKFSAKKTIVWEAEFVEENPAREIITLPNGDKYYADELQEALGKINKVV